MSTRDWLDKLGQSKDSVKNHSESKKYTEDDLKGIRVEHGMEDFQVGASEILIAKDVDVLDQDDDEVALVMPTRAFAKPSKPKAMLSFEDEDAEAEDDEAFVIGEARTNLPSADDVAAAERRAVFDTNLGATTEIVSSGPVKRKRQSRKKEFSDVPVFQPRKDVEMVPATAPLEEDEDDFGISRAITASRQRNIELIRDRLLAGGEQQEEDSEMTESAGYRDGTSLLALNTFMASIKRPGRAKEDAVDNIRESVPVKVDVSQVADRQMESLLDEPLVSSSLGVGKALEFLRIRGRPLTLVKEHRNVRDIKLAYYDEFGNEISAKEAYKSLSHKFHGNKSGKNKEEKRLKRIQERQQSKAAVLVGDGSKAVKRIKPKRQKHASGTGSTQAKPQEANVPKKPRVFGFK